MSTEKILAECLSCVDRFDPTRGTIIEVDADGDGDCERCGMCPEGQYRLLEEEEYEVYKDEL